MNRNGGLDLLRATAAGLVFAGHLYHNFGLTWLGPLAEGGRLGLYIFFPLSGYLLYRPFIEGRVNLRRYARSRALRILPAYYLALVGLALVGQAPINPATMTVTATMFDLNGILHSGFGQSWTLGVELAFYALLPLLAMVPGRWLAALMVGSWLLSMAIPRESWLSWQLPAQLWAFGLGMAAARLSIGSLAGLPLLVFGLVAFPDGGPGYAVVAIGATMLIRWSADQPLNLSWARWPADISYSVYLWHLGVLGTLAALGASGVVLGGLAVIVTVAVAAASWRYLERPLLRRNVGVHELGVVPQRAGGPGLGPREIEFELR